jgi:competence protein ComEC
MVTSIILLAVSWCAPLVWLATKVLKFFLMLLTSSVSWIESLPAASLDNIFITNTSSLLLYAALAMLVVYGHYKRNNHLKLALATLCLFTASIAIFDRAKNINTQLIIYNKTKSQLYTIKNGDKMSIITDNAKPDEKSLSPATINAALTHANLVEILNTDTLSSIKELFWQIDNKTFYNVKSHQQIEIMDGESLPVDYIIVSDNTIINANDLSEKFGCNNVIFDSSNTKKFVAARTSEYEKQGINCFDVAKDGAFVFGDGAKTIWWY